MSAPLRLSKGRITADGNYHVRSTIPGSRALVEWTGSLGGATVVLGRVMPDESVVGYLNASGRPLQFTRPEDLFDVLVGTSGVLALAVVGATAETSFDVHCCQPRDE